ncbi:MAG: hypothetical protein ACQESN_04325 [Thermotogota bacterium]
MYNKYSNTNFVNHILSEDFSKFLTSLSVLRKDLKLNATDTENILIIFPFIEDELNEIFVKGYMEEDYYKSLYRLEGLSKKINIANFDAFLNSLVSQVIKNSVYLDGEMKNFINTFIPKNIQENINKIIQENQIYLSEGNFVSAYRLLSFMQENGVINSNNLTVLKKLENYFDLKNYLTEMNNRVYFLEKTDMRSFLKEIYNKGKDLSDMSLENDLLKDLYLSVIKTMNNRLNSIDENIIANIDLNSLMGEFDEDIENEIIKLSSKIEITNDSTDITKDSTETVVSSPTLNSDLEEKTEQSSKDRSILIIYLGIIVGILIFTIVYFEFKPSIKKVELLCKIGLGKYALHLSEKIVMKKPNDYKSYLAMAKSFEAIGEYKSSISSYKKAMKLKEKGETK